MKRATLMLALATALTARAESHKVMLRLATVAPDGTAWARELRAFSRDLLEVTGGDVNVKWFFGGIAGSDVDAMERIKRDQLDGIGSGGMLCAKISPTYSALHLPGLYRNREEVRHIAGQLRGQFEEESHKAGLTYLGHAVLGPNLLFSRRPLRSFADVKREKMWAWDIDTTTVPALSAVGMNLEPASVEAAGPLYAEGRIDGFVAMPAAMLAFQWSAQVKYVTDLPTNYLVSCVMLTDRAFDKMPVQHQAAVKTAVAKLSLRLEAVGEDMDQKLLAGGFGRQGLTPIAPSDALRSEFWTTANAAAEKLGDKLVPASLRKKVVDLLIQHRSTR